MRKYFLLKKLKKVLKIKKQAVPLRFLKSNKVINNKHIYHASHSRNSRPTV
jgi:hypothetical protein